MNVYKEFPVLKNDKYELCPLKDEFLHDLLKVYSDVNAVQFFNGDNCHGDNFFYETEERMKQALDFWKEAYEKGWFVRFAILDNQANEVIGTIEGFRREENDYFTDCGLLRLDLRSDYEKSSEIESIMSLISVPSFEIFGCTKVATKTFPNGNERKKALKSLGFELSDEPLIGHDGTKYYGYYVLLK